MPSVAKVSTTDDRSVNAVLSGTKWASDEITFSFPQSGSAYGSNYGFGEPRAGFEAFNQTQQSAVRAILAGYSAVADLAFHEIQETSNQHATLRFAESNKPGTAWAYYPASPASGGDLWFRHSIGLYNNPDEGNYAWLTFIHEIGHALGLKHPHEKFGIFNAMPSGHDSLEFSVMSYRSFVGAHKDVYTNNTTSFPQSLMMYDIAAIQALYGANFNTNSGDTVYQWSALTGEMTINGQRQGEPAGNKVFMTLWDGGGHDTFDFSNYTGATTIDLRPGEWSITSIDQLANLGGAHLARGNVANALLYHGNPASLIEDAIGGSGNDTITGNFANNRLQGGAGDDHLDGGAGVDVAIYSGVSFDYQWIANLDGSWTIIDVRDGNPDGTDTLINIQFLDFADLQVALGDDISASDGFGNGVSAKNDFYVTSGKRVHGNVLSNDIAFGADLLAIGIVKLPHRGKLHFDADGNFTYSAPKHFHGVVKFSYQVSDEAAHSDVAVVKIKIAHKVATHPSVGNGESTGRGANDHHHQNDVSALEIARGHRPEIFYDQVPWARHPGNADSTIAQDNSSWPFWNTHHDVLW